MPTDMDQWQASAERCSATSVRLALSGWVRFIDTEWLVEIELDCYCEA